MLRTVAVLLLSVGWLAGAGRTILAVGAHAGDMEITAGAVLARHARSGDRVVLLHLSLGERGNPKMTAEEYAKQKRREALAAAKALGAEVVFGPWTDAAVPRGPEAARWVADAIAKVRPTHVITHWRHSIHRDHSVTHEVVNDAVLLASVEGHRGLRGIWYAENWEDKEGFQPYVYVDVSREDIERWRRAVTEYEFIRGGISSFRYLDYYDALARLRGAESGRGFAVAFDVDLLGKKRVMNELP